MSPRRQMSGPHRRELAERRFPTRRAIQRLGLCRVGFSPLPWSRRPQSAKTFFRQGLFQTLAMSPLAHHARPHRPQNPIFPGPHRIRVRRRLTAGSATTRAGSQRLRVFRSGTNTGALRSKTRRHWLCRRRSDSALDVAAASRGFSRPHRFQQTQHIAHSRYSPVGLREAPPDCTARCAPSRILRVVASVPP